MLRFSEPEDEFDRVLLAVVPPATVAAAGVNCCCCCYKQIINKLQQLDSHVTIHKVCWLKLGWYRVVGEGILGNMGTVQASSWVGGDGERS